MTIIQRSDSPAELDRQSQAAGPVLRFVRGEISRKRAMAELGDISYATLIDRVVEQGLKLPTLPESELDHMADDLVRLLTDPV